MAGKGNGKNFKNNTKQKFIDKKNLKGEKISGQKLANENTKQNGENVDEDKVR